MTQQYSSFVFGFDNMSFVVVLFASLSLASADGVECESGLWRCDDGQCQEAVACDGELQCRDGSDESLARCRGIQRPLLALILHCSQPGSSSHAVCPGACRRWPEYCYYAIAAENGVPGTCELPPYPSVGDYSLEAIQPARGRGLADFTLLYSCPPGSNLHGNHPRCVSGSWTGDFPSCRQDRYCQLPKHASVDYICMDVPSHECPEWVGSEQRVSAVCWPGYMGEREATTVMRCIDGSWDYVAICRPECGTTSMDPLGSRRGELPWHATVYYKLKPHEVPEQLCGGSLVSTTVVISAAHCFWTEGEGVASGGLEYFAVGVGKIYRPWDAKNDGQKSNVSDIKVSPRYFGRRTNYQADIALVVLATRMIITPFVRPVCVNFGVQFDELQLRPGNVGKVAVWNLMPELKTLEMESMDMAECMGRVPPSFVPFISSDKICARPVHAGTAMCAGDSGGGLMFPSIEAGVRRWYLRGIASVGATTDGKCSYNDTIFTQLVHHQAFITSVGAEVTSRSHL